jgi:Dolichyl-phosphate-mannose-protein mannosyltransferase
VHEEGPPSGRYRPDGGVRRGVAVEIVLAGALTTLAIALRCSGIASRSLWLDEAWRANLATAPSWAAFWSQVIHGVGFERMGAPMPPLLALALRLTTLAGGRTEAALRAVPFLASIAAVPLAYLLARRWIGKTGALVAAWCLAAYPPLVLHGQELKPYSVDVLVVLGVLALAGRVVDRPADGRRWGVLAMGEALTPGLSYPAALLLPGVALALLRNRGDARARWSWLWSHAGAGAAAVAWYVTVIGPQRARPRVLAFWAQGFPSSHGGPALVWAGRQVVALLRYACGEPVWLYAGLVLGGLLVMAGWLRTTIVVTLLAVLVAAILRLYPFAPGRTALFLLPLPYLALAAAVDAIARRRVAAASSGRRLAWSAAVAASVLVLVPPARGARSVRPVVEETRPLVRWLDAAREPDDRVYVYYSAVPAFRFYHPTLDAGIVLGGSHRGDPAAYASDLRPALVPGTRLWLLFSHVVTTPSGASERSLILGQAALYGRELAARETAGASLHLYEVTRAPGSVRHLEVRPEDLRDPARLRRLLERRREGPE